METNPIPDDIRRFILHKVPSVPYLEAIMLMRGSRTTTWEAASLAARLYLNPRESETLLHRLQQDQIVVRDPAAQHGYRYAPDGQELSELVDRLVDTYRHHLVEVSTLIHSRTGSKAQALADAFVWKKEK